MPGALLIIPIAPTGAAAVNAVVADQTLALPTTVLTGTQAALWTPADLAVPPLLWSRHRNATWGPTDLTALPNDGSNGGNATSIAIGTSATLKGPSLGGYSSLDTSNGGSQIIYSLPAIAAGALSTFTVYRPTDLASNSGILRGPGNWASTGVVGIYLTTSTLGFFACGNGYSPGTPVIQNSAEATVNQWNFSATVLGASDVLRHNGSGQTLGSGSTSGATPAYGAGNWAVGSVSEAGGETLQGAFAEHLMFTYALTQTEMERLEGWAAWEYGLTANLPVDHPYKSTPPLAPGAYEIPTLVQTTQTAPGSAASPQTLTFANSVTVGNALFAMFSVWTSSSPAPAPTSVSDNKGNTWVKVAEGGATGGNWNSALFWCPDVTTGGTGLIVSAAGLGGASVVMQIAEFSGLDPAASVDASGVMKSGGAVGPPQTVTTSGAITLSDELVIAVLSLSAASSAIGFNVPTGYTRIGVFNDGGSITGADFEYKTLAGASLATQSAQWSWTSNDSSGGAAAVIATFQAKATGAAAAITGLVTAQTLAIPVNGTIIVTSAVADAVAAQSLSIPTSTATANHPVAAAVTSQTLAIPASTSTATVPIADTVTAQTLTLPASTATGTIRVGATVTTQTLALPTSTASAFIAAGAAVSTQTVALPASTAAGTVTVSASATAQTLAIPASTATGQTTTPSNAVVAQTLALPASTITGDVDLVGAVAAQTLTIPTSTATATIRAGAVVTAQTLTVPTSTAAGNVRVGVSVTQTLAIPANTAVTGTTPEQAGSIQTLQLPSTSLTGAVSVSATVIAQTLLIPASTATGTVANNGVNAVIDQVLALPSSSSAGDVDVGAASAQTVSIPSSQVTGTTAVFGAGAAQTLSIPASTVTGAIPVAAAVAAQTLAVPASTATGVVFWAPLAAAITQTLSLPASTAAATVAVAAAAASVLAIPASVATSAGQVTGLVQPQTLSLPTSTATGTITAPMVNAVVEDQVLAIPTSQAIVNVVPVGGTITNVGYQLSTDNSDLTGGADFSKALEQAGTAGTIAVSVAKSITTAAPEISYAWTPLGEPGAGGTSTGTITVVAAHAGANNTGITLGVSLARVNAAGTVQASVAVSAYQTVGTTAATLTYPFTNPALGTWAAGDRLRVGYHFTNSSNAARTVSLNAVSSTVATPFSITTLAQVGAYVWPQSLDIPASVATTEVDVGAQVTAQTLVIPDSAATGNREVGAALVQSLALPTSTASGTVAISGAVTAQTLVIPASTATATPVQPTRTGAVTSQTLAIPTSSASAGVVVSAQVSQQRALPASVAAGTITPSVSSVQILQLPSTALAGDVDVGVQATAQSLTIPASVATGTVVALPGANATIFQPLALPASQAAGDVDVAAQAAHVIGIPVTNAAAAHAVNAAVAVQALAIPASAATGIIEPLPGRNGVILQTLALPSSVGQGNVGVSVGSVQVLLIPANDEVAGTVEISARTQQSIGLPVTIVSGAIEPQPVALVILNGQVIVQENLLASLELEEIIAGTVIPSQDLAGSPIDRQDLMGSLDPDEDLRGQAA